MKRIINFVSSLSYSIWVLRERAPIVRCRSIDHSLINLKSNYTLVKTGEKWIGQRFRHQNNRRSIATHVGKIPENRKLRASIFCRLLFFFSSFFSLVCSLTCFRDCRGKFMRREKTSQDAHNARSTLAYEYVERTRRKVTVYTRYSRIDIRLT